MIPLIEMEPWPENLPPANTLSSGDFLAVYRDLLKGRATPRLWEHGGEKVTGR